MKKLPPFGAELDARLRYVNLPTWAIVFAGRDAWKRARDPRARIGDCCPLVWTGEPPEVFRWPVANCAVLIEVDTGPSLEQVYALARELLVSGAGGVLAWWLCWGESRPVVWGRDGRSRYLTAAEINATVWPHKHERKGERRAA
jgi:hypothetical protein